MTVPHIKTVPKADTSALDKIDKILYSRLIEQAQSPRDTDELTLIKPTVRQPIVHLDGAVKEIDTLVIHAGKKITSIKLWPQLFIQHSSGDTIESYVVPADGSLLFGTVLSFDAAMETIVTLCFIDADYPQKRVLRVWEVIDGVITLMTELKPPTVNDFSLRTDLHQGPGKIATLFNKLFKRSLNVSVKKATMSKNGTGLVVAAFLSGGKNGVGEYIVYSYDLTAYKRSRAMPLNNQASIIGYYDIPDMAISDNGDTTIVLNDTDVIVGITGSGDRFWDWHAYCNRDGVEITSFYLDYPNSTWETIIQKTIPAL